MHTYSSKDIQYHKEVSNPGGSREIFSRLSCFLDSTEQQIPRPVTIIEERYTIQAKKKRHTVKNQLTVNNHGYILHKIGYKKGRKHDYDIYKKNHPVIPNQLLIWLILDILA